MATVINTVTQLQAMELDLTADYELGKDIDASATVGWNGGLGFDPIGTHPNSFNGTFDGKGFKITELFINRPLEDQVGLFGETFHSAGEIKNVTLEDCDITGEQFVGALIGLDVATIPASIIENCHSSGSITGRGSFGGLIGFLFNGCSRCSSSCTVSDGVAGGAPQREVGGLAGWKQGTVERCFATGNVNAPTCDEVGGLIGTLDDNPVSNCYARGDVVGDRYVGGFVGLNDGDTIDNCYSTGSVTGNNDVGGFCGLNVNTVTDCFWDTQTSGQAASSGGTGKTTAQMKNIQTIQAAGWAISTIWSITEDCNGDYPCLIDVNTCCGVSSDGVDQTIIGDKVSLEAIRNLEIVYGGRAYISKSGDFIYESRYHRNV